MQISIQSFSMVPIYEQIVEQFRNAVLDGELDSGNMLPSVRALAKELDISALTVKKAYDLLEKEGLLTVVQGKGTFVAQTNPRLIKEEYQKRVERMLENAIDTGLEHHLTKSEIDCIFDMIMEEKQDNEAQQNT